MCARAQNKTECQEYQEASNFGELRPGKVHRTHLPRAAHQSGPKGEGWHLRALGRVRHTPEHAAEESSILLPIPSQISTAPQSCLKGLCSRGADSRRPRGPNTQDDGSKRLLYTPRSGRPGLVYQTGALTPVPLPRNLPGARMDPRGGHGKMRERFSERIK